MCYSTQIERDLQKLERRFRSTQDEAAFRRMNELLRLQASPEGPDIIKEAAGLTRRNPNYVRTPGADDRIFPGYFAPVIVLEKGRRLIKPMRYRLRPANTPHEIPSKYNLFNARIDSLEQRQTWRKLFMHQHALFPFIGFYEWVEDQGKKRIIQFTPERREIMWAPCLYDHWESRNGVMAIDSFALITDDPPPEIAAMGHDRCPIFLQEKHIDAWLTPADKSKDQMYSLLKDLEPVHFRHQWAA